eukprot:c10948_g1_i1 orf=1-189(-)
MSAGKKTIVSTTGQSQEEPKFQNQEEIHNTPPLPLPSLVQHQLVLSLIMKLLVRVIHHSCSMQ